MPSYALHQKYLDFYSGSRMVEPGFSYNSGTNKEWLSIEQIRELIRVHVQPDFKPL
jgi:hypothetical protein